MPRFFKSRRLRRPDEPGPSQPRPDDYIPSPSEFMRHADLASDPHLSAQETYERCTEEYPDRRGYVPRNPRERKGHRTMGNKEFQFQLKRSRGSRRKKQGEGDEGDDTEDDGDSGDDTEDDETGRKFGAKVTRAESTVAMQRKLRDGTWEGKMRYRDQAERARMGERRARESKEREKGSQPVHDAVPSGPASGELSAIGLSMAETARITIRRIPPPTPDLMQALSGLSSAGEAPTVPANAPMQFGNAPPQAGQRMLYPAPPNFGAPWAGAVPRAVSTTALPGNQQRRPVAPRPFPMAPSTTPTSRMPATTMVRTDTVLGYSEAERMRLDAEYPNPYAPGAGVPMGQRKPGVVGGGAQTREIVPGHPGQRFHFSPLPNAQGGQDVPGQQQIGRRMICSEQQRCRHRSGDGGRMMGPDSRRVGWSARF